MNGNYEIIKIAKSLGLRIQGLSEDEQVSHIAEQVGINNYNPNYDFNELLNRLNYLDHQKQNVSNGNFQNNPIAISKNNGHNFKNKTPRNKMSSHLTGLKKPNTKDDETLKRLNKNRNIQNYNKHVNAQNNQINEQKNQKDENNKITDGIKQNVAKKTLNFFGVPSSVAGPLSKQAVKDDGGVPTVTSAKMNVSLLTIATGLIFVIAIIIIIVVCLAGFMSEDDESELNSQPEVMGYITGDVEFSSLSDTLVYMNLCRRNDVSILEEQQCLASNPGKFFTHLKELYEDYQNYKDINGNAILLDIPLILETVSYYRTDSELFDNSSFDDVINELDNLAEAMVEKYQEVGDLYYKDTNSKILKCLSKNNQVVNSKTGESVYYRISDDKYISYLKYGEVHENYKGEVKKYDVDIHPDSLSTCIPSGRMYKSSDVVRYSNSSTNNSTDNSPDDPSENLPGNSDDSTNIPTNIKTQEIKIPISGLKNSYKIAWVSDLHLIASADRNSSDTAKQRYENDFYTSGTHADEWLPQIVDYLNNGNFDAVIFGGDMVDQGTTEAIKLFKKYYDQVNISNKIYVRADHDYLSDLYGEAGDQSSITSVNEIYSFSLGNVLFLGIDYSNKDLSESAYNDLISKINSASNVVIATHVPYESTVSDTLKELSLSIRNRLYYWQSEDSSAAYYYSSDSNTNMNQYLNNYIYNSSKIKYVLAGHMHAAWSGSISSNGLKEQVFNPAFNGYVGVIHLVPN